VRPTALPDATHAATVLNALADHGVQLAVDHVGTGWSALHHLRHFPTHVIKLDRTLIAGIEHDPATRTIISGVTALAHALNITVVAEGVETAEQHHHSSQLGVDFHQGFHLAAPTRTHHVHALIQSQKGRDSC
jgi:EAL domain-containing protein (putative c-di-GMP-specific phosphodiesterase class I)